MLAHGCENVVVRIPAILVDQFGMSVLTADVVIEENRNPWDARLDETSRQQAGLPATVTAIALAGLGRFLAEIKGIADTWRIDQVVGLAHEVLMSRQSRVGEGAALVQLVQE